MPACSALEVKTVESTIQPDKCSEDNKKDSRDKVFYSYFSNEQTIVLLQNNSNCRKKNCLEYVLPFRWQGPNTGNEKKSLSLFSVRKQTKRSCKLQKTKKYAYVHNSSSQSTIIKSSYTIETVTLGKMKLSQKERYTTKI